MAKKQTTKQTPDLVAGEPTVEVLEAPTEFLPILNDKKFDLALAVKTDYVSRFIPIMKVLIDLEPEFNEINFKAPTKEDSEKAKKLRLRYVREVRGVNKDTKDTAKKEALNTAGFIQEVYNTVDQASKSKEELLEAVELFQKNKEEAEKQELINERNSLLTPYGVDTTYIDLAAMPKDSFERMLSNAKSVFELNQKTQQEQEELAAKQKANEAKFGERVQRLLTLGLTFDFESAYRLNDLAVDSAFVKASTDEEFNETIQRLYKDVAAAQELKERKNQRLGKLRSLGFIENDGIYDVVFQDEIFEINIELIDTNSPEEFNTFVESVEDAKKEADRIAENKRIILNRINQVLNIGLQIDEGEDFHGFGVREASRPVLLLTDSEFDKWIESTKTLVNKKKQADKAASDAIIAKNNALQAAENKRIADKAEADRKAADELKRARLAPDKTKLRVLYDALGAIDMPEVTDEAAKKIITGVSGLIKKIQSYMAEEGKKL